MHSNFLAVLFALALAGTGPNVLMAQENGTNDTGAATTQSEGAAAESDSPKITGELSTGEEVSEGPKVGETYTVEEIGDWRLQCLKMAEGEDPCTIYQLLKDQNDNAVAEVTVFRLPPGGQIEAGATFVVPLETLLTAQLTIAVDGGQHKRYPFAFCNRIGCYARIGLTPADVTAFKRGAKAVVTIVPVAAPDQKVNLDLSLKGFTAGLAKASVVNN